MDIHREICQQTYLDIHFIRWLVSPCCSLCVAAPLAGTPLVLCFD